MAFFRIFRLSYTFHNCQSVTQHRIRMKQPKGTIISSLYLPISIVLLFPFHQYQVHIPNLFKKEKKNNFKFLAIFKEKNCSWDESYHSLLYTNLGISLVNMKSPTHLPYTENWTYADDMITGDSISPTITTRIGSNTNLKFEFEPNPTPPLPPAPSTYTILIISLKYSPRWNHTNTNWPQRMGKPKQRCTFF